MSFSFYGQLVIGPAGSGKTTYCKVIKDKSYTDGRVIRMVNLDPAIDVPEESDIYDINIQELIRIEDAMAEMKLGPNGGLVFCMEYLCENIQWLKDKIEEYDEDDYFIFDCPGQIELYMHLDVMKDIVKALKSMNMSLIAISCIDAAFLSESHKFISASLM
jgi:GTPase SAR1 family protein